MTQTVFSLSGVKLRVKLGLREVGRFQGKIGELLAQTQHQHAATSPHSTFVVHNLRLRLLTIPIPGSSDIWYPQLHRQLDSYLVYLAHEGSHCVIERVK